ncbi:LCP family protein [Streptomyces sp. NPDC058953]|uniref:LCP family protein n=1 Tax=unclassified Streptomyces TaxID=2593676 RepID=UPI0036AF53A9
MDAQSRGRADDIDPADQWVFNPQTGNYELRLDHSAAQSSPSAAPEHPRTPGPRTPSEHGDGGYGGRGGHHPGATTRGTGTGTGTGTGAGTGAGTGTGRGTGRGTDAGETDTGVPGQVPVPGQRRRSRDGSGGGGTPPGGPGRRKRKQGASRKKKILMWTGGGLALVLTAGAITGFVIYQRLDGNLNTVDVVGGANSFKKDQAVNILVIGTDKRTGKGNTAYGDRESKGHADTMILFHVSKDRSNATALSIPRDLITDIPDCQVKKDGEITTIPGTSNTRFNESLGVSGRDPGCTMRTVEEMSGIPVDHFMMADFNAVKELSTAVGGVEVCLDKPINDKDSKLNLSAGKHVVKGEEALAFVRTRKSVGHGSDLSRIEIQQQFLSSMIRKMKSGDTLTSPTKMWDLANAATKALTVDTGIGSIKKLQSLGLELAKVNTKNITFTTVPVRDNSDGATVLLEESQARPLFSMIENDVSLTEVEKKEKAAGKKTPGPLDGPRAQASDVRVAVYNGSDTTGAASATLTWLQGKGVNKSSNEANAPQNIAKTTLEYGPNQADQARKLADLMGLPAAALKQKAADAQGREPMVLTLGADFEGAGIPVSAANAKVPEGVKKVEADKQKCAA